MVQGFLKFLLRPSWKNLGKIRAPNVVQKQKKNVDEKYGGSVLNFWPASALSVVLMIKRGIHFLANKFSFWGKFLRNPALIVIRARRKEKQFVRVTLNFRNCDSQIWWTENEIEFSINYSNYSSFNRSERRMQKKGKDLYIFF